MEALMHAPIMADNEAADFALDRAGLSLGYWEGSLALVPVEFAPGSVSIFMAPASPLSQLSFTLEPASL